MMNDDDFDFVIGCVKTLRPPLSNYKYLALVQQYGTVLASYGPGIWRAATRDVAGSCVLSSIDE